MSDDKESFECLLDQFSLKRLYPKDRLFKGYGSVSDGGYRKPANQNFSPKPEEPIELESDICEFAVGLIFGPSENRVCVCGSFCPAKVFKDPSQFQICCTRIEKLKEQI